MPNLSNLSIAFRRCYLISSTIIGFARVVIDQKILLKEIPVFRSDKDLTVLISINQVAICPVEFDIIMINRLIWAFRAIISEWKSARNGTVN